MVPLVFYTLYRDYLVSTSAIEYQLVSGTLPAGKPSDCTIRISHIVLTNYTLSFMSNGTCRMDCSGDYIYEGTYECDGKIVRLSFTHGTVFEETFTGNSEMALYISDGEIYDSIYEKK